jgi:hypothetical protein
MIIWLASYPRSGNTFIRTILNSAFGVKTYSIYGDKFDIAADKLTSEIVGHQELPHQFDFDEARQSKEVFFIKTHEQFCKKYENDKAIYILRDGREATVSYFHYLRNFSDERFSFLEIINGHTFAGIWGEHYLNWCRGKNERILMFNFEKLVDGPANAIEQVRDFTGLTPVSYEIPGFEKLHSINPNFFRRGKKDSFKKELRDYEQKYFWLVNGNAMREASYIDKIPELVNQEEHDELFFTHIELSYRKIQKALEKKIEGISLQLDQQLHQKDQQLHQKDQQLHQKDQQLHQKDQQIQNIYSSYTYCLGNMLLWPIKKIVRVFQK